MKNSLVLYTKKSDNKASAPNNGYSFILSERFNKKLKEILSVMWGFLLVVVVYKWVEIATIAFLPEEVLKIQYDSIHKANAVKAEMFLQRAWLSIGGAILIMAVNIILYQIVFQIGKKRKNMEDFVCYIVWSGGISGMLYFIGNVAI